MSDQPFAPLPEGGALPKEHRTVSRVTAILERAATSPGGVRLSDFAAVLDAPVSSIHALVQGLVAVGYLRSSDQLYHLGPALGALLQPQRPQLLAVAHEALEELARETGETAALCGLVGRSVVYLDIVVSERPIRYVAPLNERRPLYPTSAGKCFLAAMPAREQNAVLALLPATERAAAAEDLATVAATGIAINRGETVPDVGALAAPIRVHGEVLACINVAGPLDRVIAARAQIEQALLAATARVAHLLP